MSREMEAKPLFWVGPTRKAVCGFPEKVRQVVGFALYQAQCGGKHVDAKPLKGFGGAGVVEIVEDRAGEAYRAVYTVRFADVVYVLHAFQKKSKRGIRTPQQDIDVIKARLKQAEVHYGDWKKQQAKKRGAG